MTDYSTDMSVTREEAHRLIDLAFLTLPEGEPLDLSDNDYTIEDIAHLKLILGHLRTGIDVANKALAKLWYEKDPTARVDIGETEYRVGQESRRVWANDDDGESLGKWLLEQGNPRLIANILPLSSMKTTPLGHYADTFVAKEQPEGDVKIIPYNPARLRGKGKVFG